MVRILGIETSCDETAIGIVDDGRLVRASVLASSQQFHAPYGGVVPEIAARVHVEVIWQVLEQALAEAGCSLADVDAVAVTQGPGLPGALVIGVSFAKALALSLDRPLIGVDHLAAHLYTGAMMVPPPVASAEGGSAPEAQALRAAAGGGMEEPLEPPCIGLVVSGGHTLLCVAHPDQRFEVLGDTKDDAAGEAFDKVAKLLGLGYPGGPVIDRLSEEGNPAAIPFPRGGAKDGYEFSFSGLKTAVYHHVHKLQAPSSKLQAAEGSVEPGAWSLGRKTIADIAASFQEAVVEILITKTLRAAHRTGLKQIVVGGGVAANRRLRQRLTEEGAARGLRVVCPPLELCVDNGAMVAGLGFALLRKGRVSPLSLSPDPNLHLVGAA